MKPMLAPGHILARPCNVLRMAPQETALTSANGGALGYGVGSGKVNIDVTAVDHESNFLHHFGAIGIPIEGAVLKGSALIVLGSGRRQHGGSNRREEAGRISAVLAADVNRYLADGLYLFAGIIKILQRTDARRIDTSLV